MRQKTVVLLVGLWALGLAGCEVVKAGFHCAQNERCWR
jgi:hypothetical protein